MEDYKLDIIIGKGPSARTLQLDLPRFTLVGATTRLGSISYPLRNRFGSTHRLEFYEPDEMSRVITRSARILGVPMDEGGAKTIAAASRQTPRVANRLLRRVRDFSEIREKDGVTAEVAREALSLFEVDAIGLEPTDRIILETVAKKFNGGPVGVQTVAAVTGEEAETIEDVYEPYLIQLGFLVRTPRGRVVTPDGFSHVGLPVPEDHQSKLL